MTTMETATSTPGFNLGSLLKAQPGLLLNVAGPYAVYQVATGQGLTEMQGLLLAGILPLLSTVVGAVRNRRVNVVGAASLAAIALGVAAGLVFQDPRILLVKDSAVTGFFGLAFLVSLFTSRPLTYALARQFGGAESRDRLERVWQSAKGRSGMRFMTLVWGLALVAEAATRVALSFVLSPATLLAISPVLAAATFGPLAIWSIKRATRARQAAAR